MYEKGMPSDILQQVLEELEEELEESRYANLAREIQKLHRLGDDIIRIYEKLTRKGHRYDDIKKALEYINEQQENHD